MDAELKAYLVDCGGDDGAQLYFAPNPNRAKYVAANEEGIKYIEVGSCVRRPQYDQYAPGPVPAKVLIEDGWWWECQGCYRRVDEDTESPVYRGATVFHSVECQEDYDAKRAEEQRLCDEAKEIVLAAYPKAANIRVTSRGDGNRWAEFDFGGRYQAHWLPGSPEIGIAPIDQAAWDAFKAGAAPAKEGKNAV